MRYINCVNPLFLLLFIVALLILSPLSAVYFIDADIGWHIASGDLIRKSGNAGLPDSFSFTAAGEPWYNMMWLAEVVMSYLYESGGANLMMFAAWMSMALLTIIMAKIIWDLQVGIIPTMLTVTLALLVFFDVSVVRPQTFSFVLLGLFYLILSSCGRPDSTRRWPLFVLPFIMALWVNWHGGFILGFTVLGAFGLGNLFSDNRSNLRNIIIVSVLCLLATLCNPFGYKIYYSVYNLMTTEGNKYVEEWRAFRFGRDLSYSLYLLFFYQLCQFYSKKIPVAEKALAFIWMPLALSCLRYTGVAAILVTPFLALSFRETISQSSRIYDNFLKEEAIYARWMQSVRLKMCLVIISLCLVIVCGMPKVQTLLRSGEEGFKEEFNPRRAVRFIMDNYKDVRLFNDYNMAGYITLESKGELKVFFDGRTAGFYSEEISKKYHKTRLAATRGEYEALDEYKINTVLMNKDTKLLHSLLRDPDWIITYEDKYFVILRRIN